MAPSGSEVGGTIVEIGVYFVELNGNHGAGTLLSGGALVSSGVMEHEVEGSKNCWLMRLSGDFSFLAL
ncbi:hypothetical protein, partial [Gluconobacter kanchanaburiensis]|uniref:hypothetical protein n=1 Tax=Gluconobacter kanchanaburiensis TaxID=563199 RepID=UPI002230D5F6